MTGRGWVVGSLGVAALVGCAGPTYHASLSIGAVPTSGDEPVEYRSVDVHSISQDTVEVSIMARYGGEPPLGAACLVIRHDSESVATHVADAEAIPGRRALSRITWRVPVTPDERHPGVSIATRRDPTQAALPEAAQAPPPVTTPTAQPDPDQPEGQAESPSLRLTIVPWLGELPAVRPGQAELEEGCATREARDGGMPLDLGPGERRAGLAGMALAAAAILGLALGAVGG